jgi:plasmid stability protein
MTTLTIKNLPDELYQALKHRAAAHRRSIDGEAIMCLEVALLEQQEDESVLLADLYWLREEAGMWVTDDFLRNAIDERRA